MFSGALLAVIVFVFLLFFAYQKRRSLNRMFSINTAAPASQFQDELKQTADAVLKQLENHIAHLEYLLEEADAKIAALNERIEAVETLSRFSAPSPGPVVDAYRAAAEIQPVAETAAVIDCPTASADEAEKPPLAPEKRELVLEMARQGYNVTEIARAVGLGKGEVMLLLHLNKK